jgi:hypothetical protein
MAARSKAWTVYVRSNVEIVGSNPAQDMDVCVRLFCVCVVLLVVSGLATGWKLFQGSYCLYKKYHETEEETRAQRRAVVPLINEWMNEWMNDVC